MKRLDAATSRERARAAEEERQRKARWDITIPHAELPEPDGNANMARLTRMAEGIHNPIVAQSPIALREHLRAIQSEAQAIIEKIDTLPRREPPA